MQGAIDRLPFAHFGVSKGVNAQHTTAMKHLLLAAFPLSLILVLAPLAQAEDDPAKPSADAIVAKVLEASGGWEAHKKHTTRKLEGSMAMGNSTFEMTILQQAPDKKHIRLSMNGEVAFEEGCNGEMVWRKDPNGVRELQGAEREQKLLEGRYFDGLEMLEEVEWTYRGEKQDGKRRFHLLDGISTRGYPASAFTLYVDTTTYLSARMEFERETDAGLMAIRVDTEDYETVDGIPFPRTITILLNGESFIAMTISQVTHGVDIWEGVFEMPGQ